VFPRCYSIPGTTLRHLLDHLDTTIDASLISLSHLFFKPVRDTPIVHVFLRQLDNLPRIVQFYKELLERKGTLATGKF
jgi:hypothetical protein